MHKGKYRGSRPRHRRPGRCYPFIRRDGGESRVADKFGKGFHRNLVGGRVPGSACKFRLIRSNGHSLHAGPGTAPSRSKPWTGKPGWPRPASYSRHLVSKGFGWLSLFANVKQSLARSPIIPTTVIQNSIILRFSATPATALGHIASKDITYRSV